MIELLAPAKDKICAKAAIDYGADAVYIGANDFGARKNAANSIEDIKEIVEYAHQFNVKVYAAVNTILTDEELKKAQKLIAELEKIGVDAIIIQDMGLLEVIRGVNAHLSVHASTQCDNRTPEKVKFLEDVGFSRVILARELSIEQIKEIKSKINVELEAFIHGALCVSYSGQCYLSYAIGGRSANRGECAQPCRKKYSLQDEDGNFIAKDKYLLCLKDFSTSKHIKELADAGVTSFKIEGRLKDVNYVKNVVAYYRKLIDDLGLKKTSSGNILMDFEPDLEKSFNRGFTDYFLSGSRNEIYSFDSPKSRGQYIGKVNKVGKDYFEIDSNISIYPQDGLCFFNNSELQGCLVNKVEKNKIYPNKMDGLKAGAEIYRNSDVEFEKILKNSKTCRKLGVKIAFDLNKISVVDEDGNSAQIEYDFEEFAKNSEKMGENIQNQLKKSGESIFLVEKVEILSEKLPFLPVSKLNELRRDLLEMLSKERYNKREERDGAERSSAPQKPLESKPLDYKANILNKSAKEFYEKHGFEVTEMAFESGLSKTGKTVMTCKHCLKHSFNICNFEPQSKPDLNLQSRLGLPTQQQEAEKVLIAAKGKSSQKLYLIDEKGKKYELKFDCKTCEMEIVF